MEKNIITINFPQDSFWVFRTLAHLQWSRNFSSPLSSTCINKNFFFLMDFLSSRLNYFKTTREEMRSEKFLHNAREAKNLQHFTTSKFIENWWINFDAMKNFLENEKLWKICRNSNYHHHRSYIIVLIFYLGIYCRIYSTWW